MGWHWNSCSSGAFLPGLGIGCFLSQLLLHVLRGSRGRRSADCASGFGGVRWVVSKGLFDSLEEAQPS